MFQKFFFNFYSYIYRIKYYFYIISYIFRSNVMCDVTLIASDGVKILAHKVILASSSDFFLSKFNNSGFNEKNKQSVRIKEIDSITLETIINYIYTFKLDITEHTIVVNK